MATTRECTANRTKEAEAVRAEPAQPRQQLRLGQVAGYFQQIADQYTPGRVRVDPRRQSGSPVLDDTRIPVYYVLGQLADGKSWAEITANHPGITEERIRAALEFAYAVFWRMPVEED